MTETVTFELDAALKKEAEAICEDMGITLSTAFLMFTKAMVRVRALPFRVKAKAKSFFSGEEREKKPSIDEIYSGDNPMINALREVAKSLEGAAERAGFKNEEELQRYAKNVIRKELWEERYAKSHA